MSMGQFIDHDITHVPMRSKYILDRQKSHKVHIIYSEKAIRIWRNLHILFEITLQRQKLFGHFRIPYKFYLARLATDLRDPFEWIEKNTQIHQAGIGN